MGGRKIMFGITRYSLTIASFCAAILAAEYAFGQMSGAAAESAPAGYDAAKGQDLYVAHCSACHQTNGEGLPGVFPPLKGSGVVNKDNAVKHIQVVLNGMQGGRAGGVSYAAVMPPFADALSDAEIADIIDYERRSWGNHGKPVTAMQVAAERGRSHKQRVSQSP
jgi:cytochrome c oxidase cbb3-type subunit 2